MIFLILFWLSAGPVEVTSGTLVVKTGETVKVEGGTFLPHPEDTVLAQKIVEKNERIRLLEVDLATEKDRAVAMDKYWKLKEEDFTAENNALRVENAALRGWWNRWGKTLTFCAISAGAAAFVTWEVVR